MIGSKAKCPVCCMKITKNAVERNGKKFCSEEHAQQHESELKEMGKKLDNCCGYKIPKEEK